MIFNEIHSIYYLTVKKVLEAAARGAETSELEAIVRETAFLDSSLSVIPNIRSGKWPLLDREMRPILDKAPLTPISTLEKRWLKAIMLDKRMRLFGIALPELSDVEPLFTPNDYKLYDAYSDGDPYESEHYIKKFNFFREAIKQERTVRIVIKRQNGTELKHIFTPHSIEYSVKDDRLRIVGGANKRCYYNLASISEYMYCDELSADISPSEKLLEVSMTVYDRRNALERIMLHFSHLEKRLTKLDSQSYSLTFYYYESDESEILIRILSFGTHIKVNSPSRFIDLIRARLMAQKRLKIN